MAAGSVRWPLVEHRLIQGRRAMTGDTDQAVSVVVADNRPHFIDMVQAELEAAGYLAVRRAENTTELREVLGRRDDGADLVIFDQALNGRDTFDVISELRQSKLGPNPSAVIMLTAWETEPFVVRGAVEAGADDLVPQPISASGLIKRMEYQLKFRGSFARSARGDGQTESLRRRAFQMGFLVELLAPVIQEGTLNMDMKSHLGLLAEVAERAEDDMKGSKFESAAQLCASMAKVAGSLSTTEGEPSEKDRQLLEPLSKAVQRAVYPEEGQEATAGRIARAVDSYKTKSED